MGSSSSKKGDLKRKASRIFTTFKQKRLYENQRKLRELAKTSPKVSPVRKNGIRPKRGRSITTELFDQHLEHTTVKSLHLNDRKKEARARLEKRRTSRRRVYQYGSLY